jgi:hypothetical protein
MDWRTRLASLALAGGALASTGCPGAFCGNANPDPCICGRADDNPKQKAECDEKTACEANGGVWDPYPPKVEDPSHDGLVEGKHCMIAPDAGLTPDAH